MKAINLILILIISIISLNGQTKVVHFKKLQEFLPASIGQEYKRSKPTGNTQSMMGVTTSVAEVTFSKSIENQSEESLIEFEISITDVSFTPFMLMAFTMLQDYESETESGYEKGITINNKFKGKLEVSSGEENKSVNLQLAVGERFLISASLNGSDDRNLVHRIISEMKLNELSELKAD